MAGITLSTTAPVTTPTVAQVACDSGWVQTSTVDGSSLSLESVKATFGIRPYASNSGGNPIFSDPTALINFQTVNAMGAAANIPAVAAFVAAMEAMGTALVAYQAARQADVATAQTAVDAANAAIATAQAAATTVQVAAQAVVETPQVLPLYTAAQAAAAAVTAAQAAAVAKLANLKIAEAALADFANPPLVT